jgi:hypothetical protein
MLKIVVKSKDLLRFVKKGLVVREIASRYKCSSDTIRKYIRRYNIKLVIGRRKGFKHSSAWKHQHRKLMLEKNPFSNKKHTEKTKLLMKKHHADFFGNNNPFKKSLKKLRNLKSHKIRCKKIWINRKKNIKNYNFWKNRVSLGMCKSLFFKHSKFHKNHKSGFYYSKKTRQRIFYRSSWELKILKYLERCQVIKNYLFDKIIVSYKIHGGIQYSRPDCLIVFRNGRELLIEIKPLNLLKYYNNWHKIKGYRLFCKKNKIQFALISEVHVNNPELFYSVLKQAYEGKLYNVKY